MSAPDNPRLLRVGAALVVVLCGAAAATLVRWRPVSWQWMGAEIGSAAVVFVIALAVGFLVLRLTRLDARLPGFDLGLHGIALGLGALVFVALVLGLLGAIGRGPLLAMLGTAAVTAVVGWRWALPAAGAAGRALAGELGAAPVLAALLAAALVMPVAAATMPEVFYDSLLYHLEAPAQWLAAGRLAAVPYTFHLNYPVNASVVYLLAQCLVPEVSGGVVHWGFLVGCAVALIALGEGLGRKTGVIAALLFVVAPSVLEIAPLAMADLAVVFWCLAAVVAWSRWAETGDRSLLVVAGLELGLAVGAKYTAVLVGAIPLAVMVVLHDRTRPTMRRALDLLLLGGAALLAFSPWMIRNGIETGNPVYPYLFEARPQFQVEHGLAREIGNRMEGGQGIGDRARHLLRAPIVLLTEGLGTAPWMGFSLFLPLPLLLLRGPLHVKVRRLLLFACVALVCWGLTVHLTRYALPFLAVLAVPSAVALLGEPTRWRRRTIAVCVGVGLVQNLMLGWITTDWGAVRDMVRGTMTREDYVASRVSHYAAARFANAHLQPTDTILFFGEARGYYCRIPHVITGPERRALLFEIAEQRGDRSLGEELRSRGFTHVLMTRTEVQRLIVEGRPVLPPPRIREDVASFLGGGVEVLFDNGNAWLARIP